MNTRLQVEHTVTEMIAGVDLVRWQLETAAGTEIEYQPRAPIGHAIECRIYAEDPANGFLPTGGRVLRVDHPTGPGIRVDSALHDGLEVSILYDAMLAKVIAWAPDRRQATRRMVAALREFALVGMVTNLPFLIEVLAGPRFAAAQISTTTIEREYKDWRPGTIDDLQTVAAGVALLAERSGGGSGWAARGNASAAGPWETLGQWRPGEARDRGGK
jgi:acetyl-CoA/propionyl-CoA carboxylase biotin carboxyl carrier protein